MFKLTANRVLLSILALFLAANSNLATAQKSGPYRSFVMTLPIISLTRERIVRMEFNLAGEASLALEGAFISKSDEYSEKDEEKTGEQINSKGYGAGVFVSRYTQPSSMAGFYWTLGAGYRQVQADWQSPADADDPDQTNYTLADDQNRYHHDAEAKGMTGHGRVGYRYVGSEWPLTIGAYVGLRHFQASISDRGDRTELDNGSAVSPMTEHEKEKLKDRYTTGFEPGLEFGFVF